ncbi:MAG TPA: SRPBCC family protein [Polyangiaceae bacterium]|nr:SRPBCC family protein [Polyangiaceae bacterium]
MLRATSADPRSLVRRASSLGWLSVGLGLTELLAPGALARLTGARDDDRTRRIVRTFGARELLAGLGILSGRATGPWVWARVAGDAMDLSALGRVTSVARRERPRASAITAAVAGITAVDVLTAVQLTKNPPGVLVRGIDVKRSITVNRSPADVYAHWRHLENLPRFMTHLEAVTVFSEKRSKWRARAPLGATVEWEAEITEDIPDALISWCSLPGSAVPNSGSVRFRQAPGDRGTEVYVHLKYDVPGRAIAKALGTLFGEEPSLQVADDLRRFKQMMELGDVADSDASIHRGPHPGRPSNGKQVHP